MPLTLNAYRRTHPLIAPCGNSRRAKSDVSDRSRISRLSLPVVYFWQLKCKTLCLIITQGALKQRRGL